MAVGLAIEIPGMTTDNYDQVMSTLGWGPDNLPAGFISHYCCETPGGLFIFDTWENAEDWQRFAESSLGAAIGAATGGHAPQIEPRFYELHRAEHR
jgi:hypothetical protein